MKKIHIILLLLILLMSACSPGENNSSSTKLVPTSQLLENVVSGSSASKLSLSISSPTPGPRNYKYLFVATNETGHDANWGGIAGADAFCNSHVPSNITGGDGGIIADGIVSDLKPFKAMVVDGVYRSAAGGEFGKIDWVFRPNTEYRRAADNAIVFTSNSDGLIDFFNNAKLQNSFAVPNIPTGIWTGLDSKDWTVWTVGTPVNCQGWTTSMLPLYGVFGNANSLDGHSLMNQVAGTSIGGTLQCGTKISPLQNLKLGILCVEQNSANPEE
ncbi:DUF1554 domain-containing protein [Leptospira perolatii]|nr:DUF1554 domain-containing protein [Leptospira perolatii]